MYSVPLLYLIQTDMSASWSNGLASCCSAYWSCDCSPNCCLACDASWVAYLPNKFSVRLLGEIAFAAGITDFCALFCLGACQVCPGGGAIARSLVRTSVREMKGIDGDGCTDCLTHCFCGSCAIYQEAKELNVRQVVAQQPTRT